MEERNNNDNHNNKKTCLFLSESATFPGRRESFHLFPKVTKPPAPRPVKADARGPTPGLFPAHAWRVLPPCSRPLVQVTSLPGSLFLICNVGTKMLNNLTAGNVKWFKTVCHFLKILNIVSIGPSNSTPR